MDQAASTNQGVLRDKRECGENANLDCDFGLSSGGYLKKTSSIGDESLHNFTDFERVAFRENPHSTGPFACRLHFYGGGGLQPVEFVQLTLGQ